MSGSWDNEPLAGADAVWLRLDHAKNRQVITALAVLDALPYDVFKEHLATRLRAYPRLFLRPVQHSGVFFWERSDSFSWEKHLTAVRLAGAADKQALQAWLSDALAEPLPDHRPLWHFFYIENYEKGPAIVMRMHHCYADGMALAQVFMALTDQPEPSEADDSPDSLVPQAGMRSRVLGTAEHFLAQIEKAGKAMRPEEGFASRAFLDSLWQTGLEGVSELMRIAALPKDAPTGLRPALGDAKHCAWSEPFPLLQLKALSQAFGCSVNDVLVSLVGGGLRRHLISQGESPEEGQSLHAALPVNLRTAEAKACKELGNQFGTVLVPLSPAISNPLERLYKAKHDMRSLRQSGLPFVSYGIMGLMGLLPAGLQAVVMDIFGNKSTLVLSNVPAPSKQRSLAGYPIRELMFWVPQAGDMGLGISLLSYAGQVQIGVNADRQLVGGVDALIQAILAELNAYQQFIGALPEEWV